MPSRSARASKSTGQGQQPHQRNTIHEQGNLPPGKRVTRQRSNGQLHHANGKTTSAVSPPALPASGLNSGCRFPRTADASFAEGAASAATTRDHATILETRERDRTCSDASLEGTGLCAEMADMAHEHASGTVGADASTSAASKNPGHAAGSPLSAVSTILTYYPLRDAISILILLLSLPPTLVFVIQTLFASLTFVPPTAGLSLSMLPNIKEILSSSNLGYPAMATILFVDLVFWVLWLPLWKPAQAYLLDLSQAVIAVSLSGAAASSGGPTYSIASCTLIVFVVHVLRYRAIHLTALDYLRSVLHKMDIGIPLDAPFFATSFDSATPLERGMALTAVRTILGIHIVSQGITTCVRRTIANNKANEKDSNVPSITKTDTEATAGTEPASRSNGSHIDGSPHPPTTSSSDGRPPGQPPAHREIKQRESSNKKRRKQANQVRSQQPLWAAIASTKVTFVKEMEQRDAADDAREAATMENHTTNPFLSGINATTDRIWISEVRDTEIYFAVELSVQSALENRDIKDNSFSATGAIDKSKPFYLRINGAAWSSTRILQSEEKGTGANTRFVGEIFGLAPLSGYLVEVVGAAKDEILCSVSLVTQPAPSTEQTAAASAAPQHQALRPSSPITTLKQSIQSAEAKLVEARNRTRKTKKDHRAAHADIKKEINLLRSKLDSSGGIDDKQERRLMQITQHKNQAEEATVELKAQIEAFGEIPEKELAESRAKRRAWQSAYDAKDSADRDLADVKAEEERELGALNADIAASELKKERLAARITQRAQELEKLLAKQQADMTAKQKRDLERGQVLQERESRQNQLQFHISQMEQEAQAYSAKAHEAWQQASALSSWTTQPPPGLSSYSSPPTPEGVLPAVQTSPPAANGILANTFGTPAFGSPFNSHATVAPSAVHRGRSSSMLSQYSGFTDNGEDYGFAPVNAQHQNSWPTMHSAATNTGVAEGRKASDAGDTTSGSGSLVNGSTNRSNSPRPDPTTRPFVPSSASKPPAPVSAFGPPGRKKTPQSPTPVGPGAIGDGR